MRLPAVLALSLALAMAGCFGGDEDPGTGTTPTPATSTPAPTGTGAGAGTGNGTGTGGGNGTGSGTTPPATPPKDVCTANVNFAEGTPPVPPAPISRTVACGAVPAGYKTLVLNITWSTTGPAVAQSGIAVTVLDSAGTAVATCPGPAAGPSPAAPAPCLAEGPIAAAGDYTLKADGSGNVAAAVTVSIR